MKKNIFFLLIILSSQIAFSQETKLEAINLYLTFDTNLQYIKDNVTFVNYVRDQKDADITILQTIQNAGGGGQEYVYIFEGNKKFAGKNDTLKFYTKADNTNDEIRQKQAQTLKIGLMQYVSHTSYADEIEISYSGNKITENPKDKWRNWVFEIGVSGYTYGEDTYQNYNTNSSISAEKLTEDWKIEIAYDNYYNLSFYYFDDDVVKSEQTTNYFRTLAAKSIGKRWALGFKDDYGNSTYNNKKTFFGFWPIAEYNIFPYSKSNIVQLRFQYLVGTKYYEYYEETIFEKTEEWLYHQRLGMAFKINKKWGYINSSVGGEHYFHDFSKNNMTFRNTINLRIIKGLSLDLSSSYSIINDQIFLPKGELTYEELLLRQQQASTTYSYSVNLELNYTFGSIYNNVVNPRFDEVY